MVRLSQVLCVWGLLVGGSEGATVWARSGQQPDALGSKGCRPNCRSRVCGSDGCGGQCGSCGKGRYCLKDRCVKGSGDPCARLHGRWIGAMYIAPLHRVRGRVSGHKKACTARFRVTYGSGWVLQDFEVTFRGGIVRFRGRRIVARSSYSPYSLDTFTGRIDRKRRRFVGKLRDARNITGKVVLKRK